MIKEYIDRYLSENEGINHSIDREQIAIAVELLRQLKQRTGRMFILGVGGSAANASHAVNDFRKIAGIECYAPTDNVAELTARVNDESWELVFEKWLETSHLSNLDMIMVFSVGGGSQTVSKNLVRAMDYAKQVDAKIISVVSRDGGYARKVSDACVLIPVVSDERITPHAEGWQGVIWHLLVNAIA